MTQLVVIYGGINYYIRRKEDDYMIISIDNELIEIDEKEIILNMKERIEDLSAVKIISKKSKIVSEKEFLKEAIKRNYLVLEEYINTNTPVKMICPNGHLVTKTSPKHFRRGVKCIYCCGLDKSTAEKRFMEEADKRGYKVIGDYINTNTPVKMECPNGHTVTTITPNNFVNKKQECSTCTGLSTELRIKKSKELFFEKANQEGYKICGEYVNAGTRVEVICPKGHLTSILPTEYLHRNSGCKICVSRDLDFLKNEFLDIVSERGYRLVGEYLNSTKPIEAICPKGHLTKIRPCTFKNGAICKICLGLDREQAKKDFLDLAEKEGYTILSPYVSALTPVKMCCPKGHITETLTPNGFKNKSYRCSKCRSYKGELAIMKLLKKYEINYEHSASYKDCRHILPLRFDFLIYDKEGNIKLIVEFDGKQHFKPVDAYGGIDEFKNGKIRDNIKNEFCKKENIELLRIPYWEFENITKILGKKLYRLGIIEK